MNAEKTEIKKYDYIDALRGIAVLGTLFIHCSKYERGINNFGVNFKELALLGNSGVQLFFMMSAVTLFMSMNQKKKLEKNPNLNFFIRRFFRIAPLFYLSIIFCLSFNLEGYWWNEFSQLNPSYLILTTVTFTNGFNPYYINSIVEGGWSIAIEMIFYAIIPILFIFIKNIKVAFWSFLASLLIASGLFIFNQKNILIESVDLWRAFTYFNFIAQLPVFLLGILLFYVIKNKEDGKLVVTEIKYPLVIFALILLFNVTFNYIQNHILISFSFFLVAFSLSQAKNILVNKLTCFLGKISYSMYLTHFPVLFLMWKLNLLDIINKQILNFGLRYFILIAITAGISYLTYKFIELPGITLGKKVIAFF
ncbi:MAG: acyltransferase family protein, partial [Bacteroidota bacterium]